MSFLFGGGRSASPVAEHAQKVVAELQVTLQEKNKQIKSLEETVQSLHEMTFSFLQEDVRRLLVRRGEIRSELGVIEESLAQRVAALESLRGVPGASKLPIDDVLLSIKRGNVDARPLSTSSSSDLKGSQLIPSAGPSSAVVPPSAPPSSIAPMPASSHKVQVLSNASLASKSVLSPGATTPSDAANDEESITNELEEIEEVLCVIRESEPRMLFIIERNNGSDVVVYILPKQSVESIVTAYRLRQFDDRSSLEQLSAHEKAVAFGALVVPNHDRDDPDIMELSIGMPPGAKTSVVSHHTASRGSSCELVGAIELPVAPDVIIDLWRGDGAGKSWATTTINGVKFCVLERLYIRSETVWGITSVVEITLYGRHPRTWDIVVEDIDLTANN